MKENREVGSLVLIREVQLVVGEHVDPTSADAPVVRPCRLAQEPCAVSVGLLEAAPTQSGDPARPEP